LILVTLVYIERKIDFSNIGLDST